MGSLHPVAEVNGVGGDAVCPATFVFAPAKGSGRRTRVPVNASIGVLLSIWSLAGHASRHRIVIEDARLVDGRIVDIAVVDGVIASIGSIEAHPGDVVVRAKGGEVIAGRRRAFRSVPEWSELVEGPAIGVTSVVLPVGPAERAWLAGTRSRAAWTGPRLATADEAASRPRVGCGFPAELLVLDPDSRALSQAVVGDQVLRRADLETRREMLARARRDLAALPPPGPGGRGLRIDAAGLPVGRVDLRADGREIHERTVAPHPIDRRWEVLEEPDGWTVLLRESEELQATIRRDSTGVTAESPSGDRIHLAGASGRPSIDLAATAAAEAASLLALAAGTSLEIPVVEITMAPEGLNLHPDRLSFRPLRPEESPRPPGAGGRAFEVRSGQGRRGGVILGSDGFPVRAWETTPTGDVEWMEPRRNAPEDRETAGNATNRP